MNARLAFTRGISSSFQDASVLEPSGVAINVDLARSQHAAYVTALRRAGVEVHELPPIDDFPDGCFVEDCAIVHEGQALITLPGTPSRVGEEQSIADALGTLVRVERTRPPATIEGGDCLRIGRRLFVGRSTRTNEAGVARVRAVFGARGYSVAEVPVNRYLHLKCICSPLDDQRILLAEGTIPPTYFDGCECLMVPHEEALGANVVSVNGWAIVAEGYPETLRAVERAGLRPIPLNISEIARADGSLTCLSLLMA